jgi:CubicO group peptidase (beta-lactamase class C family)
MRPFLISIAAGALLALSGTAAAHAQPTGQAGTIDRAAVRELLDYLRNQNSTGFVVLRRGENLIQQNWPAPASPIFGNFVHGTSASGELLEDVASQQKSFVAVLIGIAVDRGLIDVARPVSAYLGTGWSRATPEQEAAIRVVDLLTMTSGLDDRFGFAAPVGTRFFYNTPVYAVTKRILARASGKSLDEVTREWLTEPLGMRDSSWRQRPAALGDVGNATGLVTTPRDSALFGQMILAGGTAPDGRRIISQQSLRAMLAPSPVNPAYGRLWWLNGASSTVRANGQTRPGPLIPSAPADLVGAFGFLDRRLYVVPSLDLVVVRTGAAVADSDFDDQLWQRMMRLFGAAPTTRQPLR